uniref:NADH-ubiquinone oxidoreductase 15 kDa subunit n=1 Tax=Cacopsylla melanoneura TaxID=428564 RepID=A0A8D8S318_9HEMI
MPPPAIKTPFTDMFPSACSHQTFGRCRKFEDRYLQCIEAYGQSKLCETKCKDFQDDLIECNTMDKQIKRIKLMDKERQRQINAGERPKGKEYMEPAPELNSYGGTFFGTHW